MFSVDASVYGLPFALAFERVLTKLAGENSCLRMAVFLASFI